MLALCVLTLAALHGVVAMMPSDTQFLIFRDTPSYVPLINLGFVYLLALVVQYTSERGIKPTIMAVLTVFAAIPLTLAKLKMHQYYAHRGLALGLAKYVPTGRDLATKRFRFKQYYERYSYSHFGPALDLAVLLLITARFSALGGAFYWQGTTSLWIVVLSWLLAPALNNPFAFTLAGIQEDQAEWTQWLHSPAFEDWYFGQKPGSVTGDLSQNNWYSWLNAEPMHLKLLHAIARLFIYGCIALLILSQTMFRPIEEVDSIRVYASQWWLELLALVLFVALALYASRIDRGILRSCVCYALLVFVILAIFVLDHWNVIDVLFILALCIFVLGKAGVAVVELLVIVGVASPLWSASWRATPIGKSWMAGQVRRSSSANLLLPRRITLLCSNVALSSARLYAELQGLAFLGLSLLLTTILVLPLSVVVVVLSTVAIWLLLASLGTGFEQSIAGVWVLIFAFIIGALWTGLSGHKPRERNKSLYSVVRFQLMTLRLNSLHDWLLMNASVARNLAEHAAGYKEGGGATSSGK